MKTLRRIVVVALLALVLACEYDVELYCDEELGCERWSEDYPERTFCDFAGDYGEGVGNTCIEPPAGRCTVDADCDEAGAAICEVAEKVCRGCENHGECTDADAPVCSESGACVAACETSSECEPEAPICSSGGACEVCDLDGDGDSACEERDAAQPYCLASGQCAECRDSAHCDDGARVCDAASQTCRACEAHDECASGLCDLEAGMCPAPEEVVYVEAGAGGSECTQASPCPTIGEGVEVAGAGRPYIAVAAGTYEERVEIREKTVHLVGAQGAVIRPGNTPVVEIREGSDVRIVGLNVEGDGETSGEGVLCREESTLAIADTRITGHQGEGISSTSCSVTVTGSVIAENAAGGIEVDDGDFELKNNVIAKNGTEDSSFGGVFITGVSAGENLGVLAFNTVSGNEATSAVASGVRCDATVPPLTFSSNIVHGNAGGEQIDGENCSHRFSNLENGPSGEDGNIDADPGFENPEAAGDPAAGAEAEHYRLVSGSPCIDAADPDATSTEDFEGNPRPAGDGYDIGAYEYQP